MITLEEAPPDDQDYHMRCCHFFLSAWLSKLWGIVLGGGPIILRAFEGPCVAGPFHTNLVVPNSHGGSDMFTKGPILGGQDRPRHSLLDTMSQQNFATCHLHNANGTILLEVGLDRPHGHQEEFGGISRKSPCKNQGLSDFKGLFSWGGDTWRITPVSKWWIIMVSKSPNSGCSPSKPMCSTWWLWTSTLSLCLTNVWI